MVLKNPLFTALSLNCGIIVVKPSKKVGRVNWKQVTMVNGVKASSQTVECGFLHQGSVPGPLLFLMYMNDISRANAVPKLFAADTNIFIFHKTKDALFNIANTELNSLDN